MRWLHALLMLSLTLALLPTHYITAQTLAGEIVFTSDRDGGFIYHGHVINTRDIYVMQADGSNVRKLTDTPADPSPNDEDWNDDNAPAWSPDGTRIAFGRSNETYLDGDIYVMYADGSGLVDVTPSLYGGYNNTDPAWYPTGHALYYNDNYGGDIATTMIGTGPSANWDGEHADWSPDGQRIVYVSDTDTYATHDILLQGVNDDNAQNLTQGMGDNLDPAWSPDGTKIAFASNRSGDYEIYVMSADGSGVTPLMNNMIEDREPTWSPDGTQLAFTRIFANGNAEIFVMKADGSNQTNITNNPGNDRRPDWKGADQVAQRTLLVSSNSDGKVGGISFKDEDILAYNLETQRWRLYFDGTDVGISKDVDGLGIDWDGSLLLSFNAATKVNGVGQVSDADIVRFVPSQLGATTAGAFARDFTGADYGLTTANEDIDAITLGGAINLRLLSTVGDFILEDTLTGKDEDLFTIADWWNFYDSNLYLDGSTVGLTKGKEDIGGVALLDGLYLSVLGAFAVPGATGDGADIFTPTACDDTGCTFAIYWDGSAAGFGNEVIDAFELTYVTPATATSATATSATADEADPYAALDDEFADDESGEEPTFLPLVQR